MIVVVVVVETSNVTFFVDGRDEARSACSKE